MLKLKNKGRSDFLHFQNSSNLLKCKKSMSISIIALVTLTLILVVLTLTYFITSQRQTSAVFNVPSEIDLVYDDSLYFNIYLTGMFDKAASGFKFEDFGETAVSPSSPNPQKSEGFGDGKTGFLEKFKSETEKTLFYSRYGNTITYGFVAENNIELTKDKFVLNIDVEITNNKTSLKGIIVKYNYRKTFEKVFKV